MTFIPIANYDIEVARGNVPGVIAKDKFGRNITITADTLEDMWPEGGLIDFQTSEAVVDVTGGADDVMTTGDGAWKVMLEGLDDDYLEVSQEIELNGATPVASTQAFLRLTKMYVTECGSDGFNAGEIRAEWTGGSVLANTILAEAGQTEYLSFTIPAGETAVIRGMYFGITDDASSGTRSVEIYIYMRLYDEASTDNYQSWRRVHTIFLNQSGSTEHNREMFSPMLIPEKADIRCSAMSTKADTNAFGVIEYQLYHN